MAATMSPNIEGELGNGVGFIRRLKRFRQARSYSPAPQGLVCFGRRLWLARRRPNLLTALSFRRRR